MKKTFFVDSFKIDNNKTIFDNKVQNKALIDSGCPESVCGVRWLKTYESSMGCRFPEFNREESFKFGNKVFKTITYKKIPIKIGKLEDVQEVGIVETNVPQLVSGKTLEDW